MTRSPASYTGKITLENDEISVTWDGNKTPSGAGVYVIYAPVSIKRLRGESPMLYIGRSRVLSRRLQQFAAWKHPVTLRIYNMLKDADMWGKGEESARELRIAAWPSGCPMPDPALEEVLRIAAYERQHGELPPLNRNAPGYLPYLVLRRIMEGISKGLERHIQLKPERLKVRPAWDSKVAPVTYIELADELTVQVSLAWTWPTSWRSNDQKPDWWPEVGPHFIPETLCLMVHEGWRPDGHSPVLVSKSWHRCKTEQPWLCLDRVIPLPWELLSQAPDGLSKLLSASSTVEFGRELGPDLQFAAALEGVWDDLAKQLSNVGEAPKNDNTQVVDPGRPTHLDREKK